MLEKAKSTGALDQLEHAKFEKSALKSGPVDICVQNNSPLTKHMNCFVVCELSLHHGLRCRWGCF